MLNEKKRLKTAILHYYLGIRDFVWQLTYIRVIAKQIKDGKVSVAARLSIKADEILKHELYVEEVMTYDRNPRKKENRKRIYEGLFLHNPCFTS